MKQVTEKQFDAFYRKHNKLCLSPLTFEDSTNKSGSVTIRKIILQEDKKVIGIIVNWQRFWIFDNNNTEGCENENTRCTDTKNIQT